MPAKVDADDGTRAVGSNSACVSLEISTEFFHVPGVVPSSDICVVLPAMDIGEQRYGAAIPAETGALQIDSVPRGSIAFGLPCVFNQLHCGLEFGVVPAVPVIPIFE